MLGEYVQVLEKQNAKLREDISAYKKETEKLKAALQILETKGADKELIDAALTPSITRTHRRTGISSDPVCGETSYKRVSIFSYDVTCPICKVMMK